MDKQLLADMIGELEQAKRLIERRLRALYDLNGGASPKQVEARTFSEPIGTGDIRAEIDKRRQEIMVEVERTRAQAMAQVAAAKSNIPTAGGISGLKTPGASGVHGGAPQQELFEKMRQQMAEKQKRVMLAHGLTEQSAPTQEGPVDKEKK